jgi:hypothetical protein
MSEFTFDQLPTLGVKWERFGTMAQAQKFARWAERATRRWEYPCEAYVTERVDLPQADRFEVCVRNW